VAAAYVTAPHFGNFIVGAAPALAAPFIHFTDTGSAPDKVNGTVTGFFDFAPAILPLDFDSAVGAGGDDADDLAVLHPMPGGKGDFIADLVLKMLTLRHGA
jgi:hypothetical protein